MRQEDRKMGLHLIHGKNTALRALLSVSIGKRWMNLVWKRRTG